MAEQHWAFVEPEQCGPDHLEGRHAGDRPAEDQRLRVMRAFVAVDDMLAPL
jgi:hypothetical protein